MHPILFHIGSLPIYTYGVLVALAFFIGTVWVSMRAKRKGQDVDLYFQAIFWIILCGFVGARLLYVIYYPQHYLDDPMRILTDRGGLVWYGGLVSAFIASMVFVKLKGLSARLFGDVMALPTALGLAIGRVGCFMTGCCYGHQTHAPWAVQFPTGHETHPAWVHPTQLYESLALVGLILLMLQIERRVALPGLSFCLFFIGYGIIRFVLEYFRGDVVFWVGHVLTASQVFSLVGFVVGVIALFVFQTNVSRKNPLSSPLPE